mmetsp:Transcript_115335/g.229884  ORF Transcript_115335/g.229884 Transcript_115335/m.229884 type:complete len:490 (+) Transcript_115335:78-1547(+)
MTACDALAIHIQQLFQLDEEQRKVMLASLSGYACNSTQRDASAPVKGGKMGNENVADVTMRSAKVPTDPNITMSSSKIFCAEPVSPEPMKVTSGGQATTMPTPVSPSLSQGPSGNPWQKVTQDHGRNLPKGTTILLQDLLSQAAAWDPRSSGQQQTPQTTMPAAQDPDAQDRNGKLAAMKWLTQHLEKQQEASMNKLCSILAQSCSEKGSAGTSLPLQPSFSQAHAQKPVHESLPCNYVNRLKGNFRGAAPRGLGVLNAKQPSSPLGSTHMGGSVSGFGAMLLPEAAGHQQLAKSVLNRAVGPSMHGRLQQNIGNSSIKSDQGLRNSCQAGAPASVGAIGMPHDTLRIQLQSLVRVDPDRVLIVRKINRLGFASQAVLLQHFSWYGVVERVLVAHSRVKSAAAADGRIRPSGLGFVVMSKAEEARAILEQGSEHSVNDVIVNIQRFERRMAAHEADGKAEESISITPETSLSEESCSSMTNSCSSEESN